MSSYNRHFKCCQNAHHTHWSGLESIPDTNKPKHDKLYKFKDGNILDLYFNRLQTRGVIQIKVFKGTTDSVCAES
jgi:hypothetical protein